MLNSVGFTSQDSSLNSKNLSIHVLPSLPSLSSLDASFITAAAHVVSQLLAFLPGPHDLPI